MFSGVFLSKLSALNTISIKYLVMKMLRGIVLADA